MFPFIREEFSRLLLQHCDSTFTTNGYNNISYIQDPRLERC